MWNNAITLNDLMDEDSTGEGVSITDVFFDNQNSLMVMGSPETTPSSPERSVDIKPDLCTSIIVPIKSEKILLKTIYIKLKVHRYYVFLFYQTRMWRLNHLMGPVDLTNFCTRNQREQDWIERR